MLGREVSAYMHTYIGDEGVERGGIRTNSEAITVHTMCHGVCYACHRIHPSTVHSLPVCLSLSVCSYSTHPPTQPVNCSHTHTHILTLTSSPTTTLHTRV